MNNLVLTLDQSGYPVRWSTWQESVIAKCKDNVAWELGAQTIHYGGKSRLTGEISTIAVPTIIAMRGVAKITRRTPPLTNRNLFGRDRQICSYCGKVTPVERLTRDHIIPVSRGGKNTWMNCVSACKLCNCEKDDKLLSEWGKELLYVPYVPDRCEHLILANRRILADQAEFLYSHLPKHSRMLGVVNRLQ